MNRKSRALPQHRFPFAPLAAECARRWRPINEYAETSTSEVGKVAAVTGVDRTAVIRWASLGLGIDTADRAAVALNLHPGDIWPEWWHQ